MKLSIELIAELTEHLENKIKHAKTAEEIAFLIGNLNLLVALHNSDNETLTICTNYHKSKDAYLKTRGVHVRQMQMEI